MLNTFDALASLSNDEKREENDTQQNDTNASVDISAIINRLNEMETKINELVNKSTEFPARGNNDNPAPDNSDNPAPDNGADEKNGE